MPPNKKTDYIVVLVTASTSQEAKKIADALLAKKEVACVNIIKNVSSFFCWKGKIDKAKEALLVIKSKRSLFEKIVKTVKSTHSYTVPEIIALPIMAGYGPYLRWVNEVT